MRRYALLLFVPLALTVSVAASGIAARTPAHTKRQAEVNVLRVVATKWSRRRLPGLVNPRTHLLVDNTEAICRGRGKGRAGHRYARFVCVVRPQSDGPRQGLYVAYRALPRGSFQIRWLVYRRP
jgi:hypothetical protein